MGRGNGGALAGVFPVGIAPRYVAPEAMVALPNKGIAEAWGTLPDLGR